MFCLARTIQTSVGIGVATSHHVRFTGFCCRQEQSSPTYAASAPGPNHVRRRAAAVFVGLAGLVGLSGCATAQNYHPGKLPADQLARVDQICQTVLRVDAGKEQYDVCVGSLSDSLNDVSQAHVAQQARQDCFDKSFGPASPELAECLVGAPEPGAGSTRAMSARSYFTASADEISRREQLSCARLGLDPGDGDFTRCVTNLAAALYVADTP